MKWHIIFLLGYSACSYPMNYPPLYSMNYSPETKTLIEEIRQKGSEEEKRIAFRYVKEVSGKSLSQSDSRIKEEAFLNRIQTERDLQPSPRFAHIAAIIKRFEKVLEEPNPYIIQEVTDDVLRARKSFGYFEWYLASWVHKYIDYMIMEDLFERCKSNPFTHQAYNGLLRCIQREHVLTIYHQANRVCNLKEHIKNKIYPSKSLSAEFPLSSWEERPESMMGFLQLDVDINPSEVLSQAILGRYQVSYHKIIGALLRECPQFCTNKHLLSVLGINGSDCLQSDYQRDLFILFRETLHTLLQKNGNHTNAIIHEYAKTSKYDTASQFPWLLQHEYDPNEVRDGKTVLDIVVSDAYKSVGVPTPGILLENVKLLVSKGAFCQQDHTLALTRKKSWVDKTSAEFEGLRPEFDKLTAEDGQESFRLEQLLAMVNSKTKPDPEIVIIKD